MKFNFTFFSISVERLSVNCLTPTAHDDSFDFNIGTPYSVLVKVSCDLKAQQINRAKGCFPVTR